MHAQLQANMSIGKYALAHFAKFMKPGRNLIMCERNFDRDLERRLVNYFLDLALQMFHTNPACSRDEHGMRILCPHFRDQVFAVLIERIELIEDHDHGLSVYVERLQRFRHYLDLLLKLRTRNIDHMQ